MNNFSKFLLKFKTNLFQLLKVSKSSARNLTDLSCLGLKYINCSCKLLQGIYSNEQNIRYQPSGAVGIRSLPAMPTLL